MLFYFDFIINIINPNLKNYEIYFLKFAHDQRFCVNGVLHFLVYWFESGLSVLCYFSAVTPCC